MARVVQQRSNPPYLLIAFVFLFLIAAAVAILTYTQGDKLKAEVAKLQDERRLIIAEADRMDPRVVARMDQARRERQSLVRALMAEAEAGTVWVAGTPTEFTQAQSRHDEVYADPRVEAAARVGLAGTVMNLLDAREALRADKKALEEQLATAERRTQEAMKATEEVRRQVVADVQARDEQIAALQREVEARQAEMRQQVGALEGRFEQTIASLNARITELLPQIEDLVRERDRLRMDVVRLEDAIRVLKGPMTAGAQPDGKIVRADGNVVWIDLGSRDRVRPGMSFAVYGDGAMLAMAAPQADGPEQRDLAKARIVVADVQDTTSRCRVLRYDANDRIAVGDLVSNIAFDRTRTYRFVVEGNFDIFGRGRPTAAGASDVHALVEASGGQVVAELDPVRTDYVVLGDEPALPSEPRPGAPPSDHELYAQQMAVYEKYQEIKNRAISTRIPILNTNRFLALVGYVPEQTLR